MSTCATCGASPAPYDTLIAGLKLCKRCYAERVIVRLDSMAQCPKCKGTKLAVCSHCAGAGTVECDLGHEHECPRCDGDGAYGKCPECSGEGWVPAAEVAA